MSSKRSSPDNDDEIEALTSSAKRQCRVVFEPVMIPAISTVSDLDHHTLVFQNRKLTERIRVRQQIEDELRTRIEKLEKRQAQDDDMICLINRHWNRLDEDVRLLLLRFDAETSAEIEVENESKATTSFLNQLSQWDKTEVDHNLSQRVEFSRRAIGKLVQAFDRITQRNERITELLKELKGGDDAEGTRPESDQNIDKAKLNEAVVALNQEYEEDNRRLQDVVTKLQEKNHVLKLKHSKCEDTLQAAETKVEEMEKKVEEAEYALEKAQRREDKLESRLASAAKQAKRLEVQLGEVTTASSSASGIKQEPDSAVEQKSGEREVAHISKTKLDELEVQLDEQKELASSRLSELRDLADRHKTALQEIEKLRMELNSLPPEIVISSTEYRCLQSQFSVLFSETTSIRAQLEEARSQLLTAKTAHLKQIEQMETEELLAQKQLRAEMIQLEEQTHQIRREYDMLRLEFEQNMAATEQSGPINKEMRQLLNSYKTQNQQLKAEVTRFKKKWRECVNIVAKAHADLEKERKLRESAIMMPDDATASAATSTSASTSSVATASTSASCVEDPTDVEFLEEKDGGSNEDLVAVAAKLRDRIRKLKAELDVYKKQQQQPTDGAETIEQVRALLTAKEAECAQLQVQVKRLSELEKQERSKIVNEQSMRKIRQLEETIEHLKRDIATQKTEEDALLNEMEVTGQAFEDMQDQNGKALQALREKDDANFKLMSERIRSNQQMKLQREERDLIAEQVMAFQNQVEAQNMVVRKLEEKERLLQNNLATVERELHLRQQASELNKRKALEAAQSAADLKLQLEKLQTQLAEAQSALAEKTASMEEDSYRMNRDKEKISMLERKLERAKKIEKAGNSDEVLMEENRVLKEQLTCPSCKVNPKNAVLTKCFHVFCWDCVKTRYDTRQRKCPKCNAAFGANDYRRLFIA